jgi:antitoxin (DNA-binding transcriptional repressor) of toxin-antitoxin stability system
MITYTYSEARQNLSTLLDNAKKEGEILIKRKDGSSFTVRPINSSKSPLDVDGVNVKLSSEEIVSSIREIRER